MLLKTRREGVLTMTHPSVRVKLHLPVPRWSNQPASAPTLKVANSVTLNAIMDLDKVARVA